MLMKDSVTEALTRNPESENAKALAAAGGEVVRADLDDEASLAAAFQGAYGAYCLTNFWEHFSADKEIAQAENMAKAAGHAGIRHAIWSTFEDTRKWIPLDDDRMPTLQGRFKVAHFDGKAEADHFFTDNGVPTTFLLTSAYWENFIYFGMGPARGEDVYRPCRVWPPKDLGGSGLCGGFGTPWGTKSSTKAGSSTLIRSHGRSWAKMPANRGCGVTQS